MTTENVEQEKVEVVSLLNEDPKPDTTERKGYDYYVKKAEQEAAATEDETGDAKPSDDDATPEKFKGKSTADIIESYTKLEQEYGRRNNEVGDLRRLTDQLLELNKPKQEEAPAKKVEVDSLLENPNDTINDVVDNNPRLKAIEDKLAGDVIAADKKVFETAHPDWETTLHTPEFAAWVGESPVRQRMLLEADRDYDYMTGKELFDNYQLSKGNAIADATAERNGKARKAAKTAVTETGGDNSNKTVVKYKRSELIHLKLTDPNRYAAMRDEIMQAYADGNVI